MKAIKRLADGLVLCSPAMGIYIVQQQRSFRCGGETDRQQRPTPPTRVDSCGAKAKQKAHLAPKPLPTCFAPHPAERITALATSLGGSCPPPHTVKPLMFFTRKRSAGRERCSIDRFGSDERSPLLSTWTNDASSQTVRARPWARQVRESSSKQPSKPALPGAGDALEQTRVLTTSIGANGRRCCSTTCFFGCVPSSPNVRARGACVRCACCRDV